MQDENDILFNQYQLDFFGFVDVLFQAVFGFFTGSSSGTYGTGGESGFLANFSPSTVMLWLSDLWSIWVVLSWLISALLLFGLIYAYIRHEQLGLVAAEILKRQEEAFRTLHRKDVKNLRWKDVMKHIGSDRPGDWKLAIIEADIVLEELLNTLGYVGSSVGDKLKNAPTSFSTLEHAWRAHNVRNRIAHQGAEFDLSQKAARDAITEYKMVFDEFDFI